MNKFSKLKTISVLLCVLFGINLSLAANAASFSVNPQDLAAGKEAVVVLSIDTENQEINAVEIRLKFSPDEFLIKDFSDGNSIINFWVEKPKFSNEKGESTFSGIIPGGFQGANGQLLKIILSPQKTGEASFEIAEVKVLLNDGKGTEADVKISNLKFNITEAEVSSEAGHLPIKDTDPPEDFSPQVASDSAIFGGKYFLVFATQDKGSGVDYYAIQESTQTKAQFGAKGWIVAESPYLLRDQKLQSYIYVKAVDKSGNERVSAVQPRNPVVWYENLMYAIIISIVLMAVVAYIFWRKLCVKKTHE